MPSRRPVTTRRRGLPEGCVDGILLRILQPLDGIQTGTADHGQYGFISHVIPLIPFINAIRTGQFESNDQVELSEGQCIIFASTVGVVTGILFKKVPLVEPRSSTHHCLL